MTTASLNIAEDAKREKLYRRSLSPADYVGVSYVAIIGALALFFVRPLKLCALLLAAHALAIGLIVFLARRPRAAMRPDAYTKGPGVAGFRRVAGIGFSLVRFWYPLVLIVFSYKELAFLIPRVHPQDLDQQLAALDKLFFGVDPVVWLARLDSPPVTVVFQLSYLCYYIFPIALAVVLWRQRRFREMHYLLCVVLLGFFSSYLGYVSVPAIGPRFFLAGAHLRPLDGPLVTSIRSALDGFEGITRDAFPSGHVELTLLVLYCAWKLHRRTFWIIVVPASLLVVSTVYLRYHYVTDVIAGVLLALVIALLADRFYFALGGRLPRRDGPLY